jgi:hypothetical protein
MNLAKELALFSAESNFNPTKPTPRNYQSFIFLGFLAFELIFLSKIFSIT